MSKTLSFRRLVAYLGLVFALASQPLVVFADTADPGTVTPATEQVATPAPADPPAPTATEAPATAEAAPATTTEPPAPPEPERVYSYNRDTRKWDSDKWTYNQATGRYELTPKPAPKVDSEPSLAKSDSGGASGPKDGVDGATSGTSELSAVNSTDVKNVLDSIAASGSALVSKNTVASNATSGDATATATIINNLNSSITNSDNAKAATFVTDIMGDVKGDIILKPMLLKAMLEAEAGEQSDSKINLQNTSHITNDMNLTAASGDASVTKNTSAGDATTGSAHTVANVVNIVNSMIAANRSFVGTVNIYGNLDGDILIAPDFIPQLLASNSPINNSLTTQKKKLIVDTEDTKTILNNVNLNAASGQATVAGNTAAGNATTGSADTNTVIFNMTGHDVIAKNSLLVFVNVLGRWVGVIVDAPTGATSAVIGNGVTRHEQAADLAITAQNEVQIVNNLNLNALSGDALVANNTLAGSARSGDATASANIANISNSQFGLSDWFGVLYINVFGSWLGSLGLDTAAGNKPVPSGDGSTVTPTAKGPLQFIPKGSAPISASRIVPLVFGTAVRAAVDSAMLAVDSHSDGAVLAAQVGVGGSGDSATPARKPIKVDPFSIVAASVFIGGLGLVGSSSRRLRKMFGADRQQDSNIA